MLFFTGILVTVVLDRISHYLTEEGRIEDKFNSIKQVANTKKGEEDERGIEDIDIESKEERGEPGNKQQEVVSSGGDNSNDEEQVRLRKAGLITALAIGLHNFPEGLATYMATLADSSAGIAVAVAIALHNIPEGLAVAMPVYHGTGSKAKGILWGILSGVSEPLGGLFGYLILKGTDMNPLTYGVLFAVVAGMMVYISFAELLPNALNYDRTGCTTTTACFIGMALMSASLLLFEA